MRCRDNRLRHLRPVQKRCKYHRASLQAPAPAARLNARSFEADRSTADCDERTSANLRHDDRQTDRGRAAGVGTRRCHVGRPLRCRQRAVTGPYGGRSESHRERELQLLACRHCKLSVEPPLAIISSSTNMVRDVQGPILRSKITSPDGQGPIDQHSQAYLLFVDWKNFHPLLEYMCGNPVQLPRYTKHRCTLSSRICFCRH